MSSNLAAAMPGSILEHMMPYLRLRILCAQSSIVRDCWSAVRKKSLMQNSSSLPMIYANWRLATIKQTMDDICSDWLKSKDCLNANSLTHLRLACEGRYFSR